MPRRHVSRCLFLVDCLGRDACGSCSGIISLAAAATVTHGLFLLCPCRFRKPQYGVYVAMQVCDLAPASMCNATS